MGRRIAAEKLSEFYTLGTILGEAPGGRLHKRLTEKGLAATTYAFSQGLAEPGFALFGAQPQMGHAKIPFARTALTLARSSMRAAKASSRG